MSYLPHLLVVALACMPLVWLWGYGAGKRGKTKHTLYELLEIEWNDRQLYSQRLQHETLADLYYRQKPKLRRVK